MDKRVTEYKERLNNAFTHAESVAVDPAKNFNSEFIASLKKQNLRLHDHPGPKRIDLYPNGVPLRAPISWTDSSFRWNEPAYVVWIDHPILSGSYQHRVSSWLNTIFPDSVIYDVTERCHRFLEEALELVQALGYTREKAHAMVDYVFDRPKGEVGQEIGGVSVSLNALGVGITADIEGQAELELARIMQPEVMEKVKAKQYSKPVTVSEMHQADYTQSVDSGAGYIAPPPPIDED